jgi:hypothetical protein
MGMGFLLVSVLECIPEGFHFTAPVLDVLVVLDVLAAGVESPPP